MHRPRGDHFRMIPARWRSNRYSTPVRFRWSLSKYMAGSSTASERSCRSAPALAASDRSAASNAGSSGIIARVRGGSGGRIRTHANPSRAGIGDQRLELAEVPLEACPNGLVEDRRIEIRDSLAVDLVDRPVSPIEASGLGRPIGAESIGVVDLRKTGDVVDRDHWRGAAAREQARQRRIERRALKQPGILQPLLVPLGRVERERVDHVHDRLRAVAHQEVVEQEPVHDDSPADDREVQDARAGHLLEPAVHVVEVEHRSVRGAENHAVVLGQRRGPDHEEPIPVRTLVDEPLGAGVQRAVQESAYRDERGGAA